MGSENTVSHKKLIWILVGIVFGMFGFGFALVPIYNSLCSSFGINGKPSLEVYQYTSATAQVDKTRLITVEFLTTKSKGIPWKFYPVTKKVTVHPGEMKQVSFYAENDSDKTMVIQAIPSVTPGIAAKYLKKTECFCFTQQTLLSHEGMDMPLLFHLDQEIPDEVHTMTLSYTLFDVTNRVKRTN